MKPLLLAGLIVLACSDARAQRREAYDSLLGMAVSAAEDKGPQAGEIGPEIDAEPSKPASAEGAKTDGEASAAAKTASAAMRTAIPDRALTATAATAFVSGERTKARSDDEALPTANPAATPRIWTRFFSSLVPSMARASAFEVSFSTTAPRARVLPVKPVTTASSAGAAQGLLELVATATAPALPAP